MAIVVCLGGWLSQMAGAAVPVRAESLQAKASASQTFGVTAWLPYWEMPAALTSTLDNSREIGTASPYWYEIAGASRVLAEKGAGTAAVIADMLARHQELVPMVTEQAGMRAFAAILASASKRNTLVRTLVRLASHTGYSGIDIDFESFAYDPTHNTALADRVATLFPQFVAQACGALHAMGRTCQIAVMAETTPSHTYSHGDIPSWIYDYKALAAAADRVQIMTYDYHSPGGPPGPIAPLPWVEQVIAYARTQAAPSRYELGLSAYGYDWYGSTSATAVNANQLPALLTKTHAQARWDSSVGEETFTYRQHHHRHVVWIETTAADLERAKLAERAGFSGVAVWAAGYEQPQLWPGLDLSGPR